MSLALVNGSSDDTDSNSNEENKELDSVEELEAFYKLMVLEKDLLKLKDIISNVKKVKECCLVSSELKEINVSRKK